MPSTSEAQHNAMAAAAHGKSTLGIPRSVGEEFMNADKGKHFRSDATIKQMVNGALAGEERSADAVTSLQDLLKAIAESPHLSEAQKKDALAKAYEGWHKGGGKRTDAHIDPPEITTDPVMDKIDQAMDTLQVLSYRLGTLEGAGAREDAGSDSYREKLVLKAKQAAARANLLARQSPGSAAHKAALREAEEYQKQLSSARGDAAKADANKLFAVTGKFGFMRKEEYVEAPNESAAIEAAKRMPVFDKYHSFTVRAASQRLVPPKDTTASFSKPGLIGLK